ncbi:hypothetical protein [Bacillus sp. MYb209]|uniref:hypothetical protein n=1 Tax=Bacillus sp. MYb209 TaxID=1848605 RepID=UPI0021588D22|nr:hypothetical protein [Bacillus sp. MYb209]
MGRWTIEEKLKLTDEEVKRHYNRSWMKKHRLSTPLMLYWDNSPYAMIQELYPDKFQEWEFANTPRNFWTKEKGLEVLKWVIEEKEKLSDSELIEVYDIEWIRKNSLSTPLNKHWGNNPFQYLNELYPGKFQEWKFRRVRKGYWNKTTAL